MPTPFIGQHDKAVISTILFLSWMNTLLMSVILINLILTK